MWLRPFARFDARDHLGDPHRTIRENVEAFLTTHGVDPPGGRVLMLANARVLGYTFNPLTLFWCLDADDRPVRVVAEVHNTYSERHCYLLRPDETGSAEVTKQFYVSPFLTVAGRYRMRVPVPDERLRIAITLRQDGASTLVATLVGIRRRVTPAGLARLLLRHPLAPQRVAALIRRHGVALWLRRLPVIPRPPHAPQEGVQ